MQTRIIFILVKKNSFILFSFLAILTFSNFAHSSHIKNGFEALQMKDYFRAKKIMKRQLKYNPSPSSFALSVVFSRNDNPFFDLDSAYRYILISDSTWSTTKDRKKEKWRSYGWSKQGIDSLKQIISAQFYEIAHTKNTVVAYTSFLTRNPWASDFDKALYSRDSLAFHESVAVNTSFSYKQYMDTYPESEFYAIAEQNYFHAQFLESTGDGSLESYKEFVSKHPNSPLRYEADSMIFTFVTASNSLESYKDFVENYSDNSLIDKGWREFYQVYLFDYSKDRMNEFLQLYPSATNKNQVENDIIWYDSILLPYQEEQLFGLMNVEGVTILAPNYSFIGHIIDGLILIGENEKIGIIDREGKVIVPTEYDGISSVSNGRFVVEKNEMLGLIDRKGRVLIPCTMDDIGNLKNELVYVAENDSYFYTNYNGVKVNDQTYLDANDFRDNKAIVATENGSGVIDKAGNFILPAEFEQLKWLNDSIFAFSVNEKWGMITLKKDTLLSPKHTYIDEFIEGVALASSGDTLLYLNTMAENDFGQFFEIFPNYRVKGEFSNGTAIVSLKGKYGRINRKGDVITDMEYENLGAGTRFIPFEDDGNWGVLSLSNKVLIEAEYERIEMIDERYAITTNNDSLGLVNVKGSIVIPTKFQSIDFLTGDCFAVYDGQFYGLYIGNELVTELKFVKIELFNKEIVSLTGRKEITYYDIKHNKIIKSQINVE